MLNILSTGVTSVRTRNLLLASAVAALLILVGCGAALGGGSAKTSTSTSSTVSGSGSSAGRLRPPQPPHSVNISPSASGSTTDCGAAWTASLQQLSKLTPGQSISAVQIVSWNDYEAGSQIEAGVENCVVITPQVNNDTISWQVTGNTESIDHYAVFASPDGTNLTLLANVPAGTTTFDLTTVSLPAGDSLSVFVQAVGKPSVVNKISASVSYSRRWSQAATPTFSPAAGTYSAAQSVAISSTTSGATICYSTNGTTPAAGTPGTCSTGSTYSGPVSVASSETLRAIATETGHTNSSVASAAYTITAAAAATPTFSPAAGTYSAAQSVAISTTTSGATICYSTNGTIPAAGTPGTCSTGSTYSGPVSVASSETLMAIVTKTGYTNSGVASAAYTITPGDGGHTDLLPRSRDLQRRAERRHLHHHQRRHHLLLHQRHHPGSRHPRDLQHRVHLLRAGFRSQQRNAHGHRHQDWLYEFQCGQRRLYDRPGGGHTDLLPRSRDLQRRAERRHLHHHQRRHHLLHHQRHHPGSRHPRDLQHRVHLLRTGFRSQQRNAHGHRHRDWPYEFQRGQRRLYHHRDGGHAYLLPAAGTYSAAQSVTISTATSGATICYTTNGTTPAAGTPGTCSTGSTYSGPVSVASSETLRAIVTKTGYTNSSVASAAYTIATIASPLSITTTTCPAGTQLTAYSGCTMAATGGVSPYTWSVGGSSSGYAPLPEGMSLNASTGAITSSLLGGQGTYITDLIVTDSASNTASQTITFSIAGNNSYLPSIFPSDSIFHHRVDATTTGLPVDTSPAAPIPSSYQSSTIKPFFGNAANGNFPNGIPAVEVPCSQANVSVSTTSGGHSYFTSGPIPSYAPIEATAYQSNPNSYIGDGHVLVYQQGGCSGVNPSLWEQYEGQLQAGGSWLDAGNALWSNVTSDALIMQTTTDEAGLPISPLLLNADEVIGTGTSSAPNGTIQHPTRFTLGATLNYWVWPGTATSGSGTCSNSSGQISTYTLLSQSLPPTSCTTSGVPGEIYRLKASVATPSCASSSPQAAIIIMALRNYGIILADNGSSGGLIGTPDTRWNDTDLSCLRQLTLANFEPVNVSSLMISSSSGQTPTTPSMVSTPTFSPAAGTYSSAQSVAISTTTSGATICYTTNGTTPAASTAGTCSTGSIYSGPVSVASSETLMAIATKTGYTNSSVASAAYTITPATAATPTFSPQRGPTAPRRASPSPPPPAAPPSATPPTAPPRQPAPPGPAAPGPPTPDRFP